MRTKALFVPLAALALTLTACSAGTEPAKSGEAPVVMVTTTTLGSITSQIAQCAGGTSETIMPAGADPHTFAVSSDQVARMVKAKLVVVNGLGLESGMEKTLENVKKDGGKVYEVGPNVDPIERYAPDKAAEDEHAHGEEGHDHGPLDPHIWLDVKRMAKAAENIGAELAKVTGDAKYTDCGKQVGADLTKLDEEIRTTVQQVPEARRVLITDHLAYNYFAKAYNYKMAGVVVPGGSTDAEPSAADIAKVVKVIKDNKVPAIFSNTSVDPKTVEMVAKDSGQNIKVVPLYTGSVGPKGSGAETYQGMMRENAKRIAEALK